jgi:hypothetical protein
MRCLLLLVLSTGTSFGQNTTDHDPTPKPDMRPTGGTQFDPNAPQITIEVRFLSGPPEMFQRLHANDLIRRAPAPPKPELPSVSDAQLRAGNGIQLVSATRVVEEQQSVFVQRLADKRVFDLIEAVQKHEQANILFAPKVTLFDGQKASVTDQTQRPFVVALQRNGADLEPQIEGIPEGTSIDVRATTKPGAIRMDLAIQLSQIANVKTRPAGPANTAIQVPRVAASRVALSALVKDGDTLVVSGLQRTVEVRKEERVLGMFKNVSVGRTTEDTLILITPRITLPDNKPGRTVLEKISAVDWCGTPAAYSAMINRQRNR